MASNESNQTAKASGPTRARPFTSAGIHRQPSRRARDLDLWRTRQRCHHASGLPQHRSDDGAAVRRAARPTKGRSLHRDRHRQRRLHAQVLQSITQRGGDGGSARCDRRVGARHLRLDGPQPRLQSGVPRNSGRELRFLCAVSGERAALVQEGAGGGHVRQSRDRQSSGGSQQGTRRGARRVHARGEGDRRRPDRQRREGRRHHFHADALQLHRQQRRAAHQDQGFRLRLHRAHGRARRETLLPAVL